MMIQERRIKGADVTSGNHYEANQLFFSLVGAAILGELLALTGIVDSHVKHLLGVLFDANFFFLSAMIASISLYFYTFRDRESVRQFSVLAGFALLLVFIVFPWGNAGALKFAKYVVGACFVSLLVGLVIDRAQGRKPVSIFGYGRQVVFLLPLFIFSSAYYLQLSSAIFPITLDVLLFRVDFAVFPEWVRYGMLLGSDVAALRTLLIVVYMALPAAVALLFILSVQRGEGHGLGVLKLFLYCGFFGYLFYFIFPACGPNYFFNGAYPEVVSEQVFAASRSLVLPANRNAMPSLHTAWALLLVLNSRSFSIPWRVFFYAFAALTLVATVVLGEHYVIDLVLAVPFVVALQVMYAEPIAATVSKFIAGVCLTIALLWLVLIYGDYLPFQSDLLTTLLVASSAVLPSLLYIYRHKLTNQLGKYSEVLS